MSQKSSPVVLRPDILVCEVGEETSNCGETRTPIGCRRRAAKRVRYSSRGVLSYLIEGAH